MSNTLTGEEERWTEELRAAAVKAEVQVPSRFWLAAFAIVSKGDVKKGLTRMQNFQKVEEEYKLSGCSEEAATEWFRNTYPNFILNLGGAKSGRVGYGVRMCDFDPTLIKSEQDWQYIIKTLVLNLQSVTPTISHVRDGMVTVSKMTNMGFKNFSPSTERRMAAVHQDAFPVKLKEIYIVDPPSIFKVILKVVRLFLKKKVIDRVVTVSSEQMIDFCDASCMPADLGGTFTEDFFESRARGLDQHRRSVAEMEIGAN